ncbi:MAG: methionyl-tRNA formyltransferase, partial [Pseudomonadota bacterium]
EAAELPIRDPVSLKPAEVTAAFAALDADVAVVVAYGLILPQAVLEAPRQGCLNIHASLLPRWRGAAPIQRAVMAGDAETGVCIMQMEAGLDTGPVLLRRRTAIGPEETSGDLHDRLSVIGAETIVAALTNLGALSPEPQPETGVTYAAKIDKAEASVDWTQPAEVIARQIRGLSPFPGAWTTLSGRRLKLLRAVATTGEAAPGEVIEAGPGLTVAAGSGAVAITTLQADGRGRQDTASYLRGTTITPGTILGGEP